MNKFLKILATLSGNRARQVLTFLARVIFWATLATVVYLMLGLLMPVHAQTVTVNNLSQYTEATGSGDWSLKLWVAILGDFARNPWGSLGTPTTLLGRLFLYFNAAIFSLSVAYLSWGVLKAVIGTTQDGEAMGSKVSSAWYPIRTVIGVGGGLPLVGGWTVLQALLMSAALLGIGLANLMYRSAVQDPTMVQLVGVNAISGAPAVRPSQVMSAATSMLRSNLCMASYQQAAVVFKAEMQRGDPGWAGRAPEEYYITRTLDAQPGSLRIRYGWSGDPEACGSVSVRMDKYRDEDSSDFRVASVDYKHIRNTIGMKASQQLIAADDMIRPLAEKWLKLRNAQRYGQTLELSVDMKKLGEVAETYTAGIKQLVTLNLENSGSSIKSAAQAKMLDGGWVVAGSYYSTWAEANAALADAVSGLTFNSSPPSTEYINSEVVEDLARLEKAIGAAADRLYGGSGAGRDDQAWSNILGDACDKGGVNISATGNCSLGQSIARRLVGKTLGFNGSGGGQSWRDNIGLVNPLIALKDVGDYVLTISAAMIAIGPVAEIGGKALAIAGAAATATGVAAAPGMAAMAAGAIASYVVPLGWTFFLIGTALAVYLPLLPFITWIGGVMSYLFSFLEGLIAAPLHSLSHMNTEGEGLGQATSRGYLFILNAFARPACMVLGFFIASAAVVAGGTLVTYLFAPAIAGVQGNSVTGLASIIGLLVVYVLINVMVIQKSFEFCIGEMPDRIIEYVGAGVASLSMGRDAEQKINAAFAMATRQGMGGAQASIGAGSKAVQKIKPQAKGTK